MVARGRKRERKRNGQAEHRRMEATGTVLCATVMMDVWHYWAKLYDCSM